MRSQFRKLVLSAGRRPVWLASTGPADDVVLSTRIRVMRNLAGYRFPSAFDHEEAIEIESKAIQAGSKLKLDPQEQLTQLDRDYLVGLRLASPDFLWYEPGRNVLFDSSQSLSVLVNEEDHLRIQSVGAGWSLEPNLKAASKVAVRFESEFAMAKCEPFGYLAASPANCGSGVRMSVLVHVLGLAHLKKISQVIEALGADGITVRGLYGESSRGIGAFFQISVVEDTMTRFRGAVHYLIDQELAARSRISEEALHRQVRQAATYCLSNSKLSLADAVRIISWIRLACCLGGGFCGVSHRDLDRKMGTLEVEVDAVDPDGSRARQLHSFFEGAEIKLY